MNTDINVNETSYSLVSNILEKDIKKNKRTGIALYATINILAHIASIRSLMAQWLSRASQGHEVYC